MDLLPRFFFPDIIPPFTSSNLFCSNTLVLSSLDLYALLKSFWPSAIVSYWYCNVPFLYTNARRTASWRPKFFWRHCSLSTFLIIIVLSKCLTLFTGDSRPRLHSSLSDNLNDVSISFWVYHVWTFSLCGISYLLLVSPILLFLGIEIFVSFCCSSCVFCIF